MDAYDRELGMDRKIARRDFLNGVAVAVGGSLVAPSWLEGRGLRPAAQSGGQAAGGDPPARTGMRGLHPGSFEVAHQVRDGATFDNATDTGERYDLVVVGAGISGLAGAYFFHNDAGRGSRVLVLDSSQDFGGHCSRNEFTYRGRTLLINGGTSNLEQCDQYSAVARTLMRAIGIDFERFEKASNTDGEVYDAMNLGSATFFCREVFGEDRLVLGSPGGRFSSGGGGGTAYAEWLAKTPLSAAAQKDLVRLNSDKHPDYMPGLSDAEKKDRLARMCYKDFLQNVVKLHPDAVNYLSLGGGRGGRMEVTEALRFALSRRGARPAPVFGGMNLEPYPKVGPLTHIGGEQHGQDVVFGGGPTLIFPDGNATATRLVVRALIPDAVPGSTMEDVITARVNYGLLDRAGAPVRLRLSSTVVRVKHVGEPDSAREVEVTYVRGGKAETVRAAHVLLACYNRMIPYLCPEMSLTQKDALAYGVRRVNLYNNVLIRDWTAFAKLGVRSISCPGMFHGNFSLGRNQVFGGYTGPRTPQDPMVVRMSQDLLGPGETEREQQSTGRLELHATSFETYERKIRDQMARGLAGSGFDPARDIVAITVNRWAHGYAYRYNALFEPIEWALLDAADRPCYVARRQFGRISIGNTDTQATPHFDAGIDQAYRAVGEQLVVRSRSEQRTTSTASR